MVIFMIVLLVLYSTMIAICARTHNVLGVMGWLCAAILMAYDLVSAF